MKKKLTAVALIVCMLAIMLVGASLAYFTDEAEAENTFTVGNVDIEIVESKLHRDLDAAADEAIKADSEGYQAYLAEAGEDLMPGIWVRKAPYIENVGSNAAYVRVNLTVNKELDEHLEIMEYTTAQEAGEISAVTSKTEGDNTIYTWTFLKPLDAKALSQYAPFWQFRINPNAENADLADFAGDVVNKLIVTAEAIQAEGFGSAADAFAAYDAE